MTYESGCGPKACRGPDDIWGCAFPRSMLKQMLEVHEGVQFLYNEVVVEVQTMVVEAVFRGDWDENTELIHQRFLDHFKLNANQLPLLNFEHRALDPFST